MYCDCHMHMLLDAENWRDAIARHSTGPDIPFIRKTLQHYRDLGFTYLRDGGDRWGVGKTARELAAEYGITYRTPLAPLILEGHYGSFIGVCYRDLKEYARLVCRHRDDGADFIKIMISGLMDFDRFGVLTEEGLPPQLIGELIHIAHEEGLSVMAHANGARTVEAAACAGGFLKNISKYLMIVTLFLIGANLNRAKLKELGLKPVLQGLILWILLAALWCCAIHWNWIRCVR